MHIITSVEDVWRAVRDTDRMRHRERSMNPPRPKRKRRPRKGGKRK